jgi:RNA polymerase sigma factor (sigma-70 family)
MVNQEEMQYIERIRNGEHGVYGILVDRYKTLAYSIALRVLGIQEDAEDVAQEGFIKAYEQLHQFEGTSKFSTWLYTIVYRTALAKIQSRKVRIFSITDHFSRNFTSDHSVPQLAELHASDNKRAVEQAINKLPKTEALVVMLYYISENSVSEIGEITGLSGANIKIQLFRARKKLQRELSHLLDDNEQNLAKYGKGR